MQEDVKNAHPNTVYTFSGKYIVITELKGEDICIEDIAHALSFKPRFNGNCKLFYSIAAHSISVASLVSKENKMQALLHDAAEAYLFDIPKPYKSLPQFSELVKLEDEVQLKIYDRYLKHFNTQEMEIKCADINEFNREWELAVHDNYLASDPMSDKMRFMRSFIDYCSLLQLDESNSHIYEEVKYLIKKYKL